MAASRHRMKVSAQSATTITLVADLGDDVAGDMARQPTDIVITWPTARDEYLFPAGAAAINTRIEVKLDRM
jgi:hypothetical protein